MTLPHTDELMEQLEIKNQQLLQQKEQINKYKNWFLGNTSMDEDSFIYSSNYSEEITILIGRHLKEFSEMIYDHNYLLIIRKEINKNLGVCLIAFGGNCKLETTLEAINKLVDRKRKEEKITGHYTNTRSAPSEMKILTEEIGELNAKIARLTTQIELSQREKANMDKKWQLLEQINENIKSDKDKTTNLLESMYTTIHKISCDITVRSNEIDNEKKKVREDERQNFYEQYNLEYIKNSPYILKKMCKRLSEKHDGDQCSPPLETVKSMKDKQKELITYFDLLQQNLDDYVTQPIIQKNLKQWFEKNWTQLLYHPSVTEKEEIKKEMERVYGWKETIGTAHYVPLKWGTAFAKSLWFLCLAISNRRIIEWNCNLSKSGLAEHLIKVQWDERYKFLTDLETDETAKKLFTQVSNYEFERMRDHQKVVEWFTNNFESLKTPLVSGYYYSFPAIYNMALQYFEESIQ